jgi:uncharacterized repeat protein (TIGR03843 family)
MPQDELETAGLRTAVASARLELLRTGDIEIEGRMPWSSNATFLVNLCSATMRGQAIYKPVRGERPLWDFDPGLYRREVAAYLLSEAMGFHMVPPTLVRDGPFGEGSLQWFVDVDHQEHYFTIYEKREDLHDQLRKMCVLDIVANNTDRKSGHCLLGRDDQIWGIDHGLCFAADFKLRTVIWEFGGQSIPDTVVEPLQRLVDRVPLGISALLSDDETLAIQERAEWLLRQGEFPIDPTGRRYPWPLV